MNRLDSLMNDQLQFQLLHVAPRDSIKVFRLILKSHRSVIDDNLRPQIVNVVTYGHNPEYTESTGSNKRKTSHTFPFRPAGKGVER